MATPHAVQLALLDAAGGPPTIVDVFDEYTIALDMFRPGSPWTFSMWHSGEADPVVEGARHATAWTTLKRAVRLGGQVLFSIDGAPQLNGIIEELDEPVDPEKGAALVIAGRDLSALALDWEADPRLSFRGRALEDVLRDAFNRAGVQAVIGYGADAAREVSSRARPGARGASTHVTHRRHRVSLAHPRPGERTWAFCDSIARRAGYLMWVAPNADGVNQMAVVVDTPAYDAAPVFDFRSHLVPGRAGLEATPDSNALARGFKASLRGVPARINIAGHAPRGDAHPARFRPFVDNAGLARYAGTLVADPLPPQNAWLHARARDVAGATREAQRAMAAAMREWRTYTCTVQGHGQVVDGRPRLFALNTMAHVYDRVGGFTRLDEDMLVTRVEFRGSAAAGQTTTLTLGTRDAIDLTPAPDDA